MKKIVLSAMTGIVASFGFAQTTATNFTVNDCDAKNHNLFSELDAGKVIVLCWVMPCGTCTGPAQTTYNVVQGYAATNPGRVYMYLCDDYANSSCSSTSSYASSIGLVNVTCFSNAAIKMTDYGSTGMPKIVVLGGTCQHKVYYNVNNSVNQTSLQNAINSALAVTPISLSTAAINVSASGGSDGYAQVTVSGGISGYAYLWNDPASQITSTATGLKAGTYTVTVTDAAGCKMSASQSVAEPTGISTQAAVDGSSALILFPNPADNFVTISLSLEKSTVVTVELFSPTGKKVSFLYPGTLVTGENKIEIPTAELNSGIYFVKVNGADKRKMTKLFVYH